MMKLPSPLLWLPTVLMLVMLSACEGAHPKFKTDPGRSTDLEERGKAMLSDDEIGVKKIKLPADSFQMRGPHLPDSSRRVSIQTNGEVKFSDMLLGVQRETGLRFMIDARVTKQDDINALNQQIAAINSQALRQAPAAPVVPPLPQQPGAGQPPMQGQVPAGQPMPMPTPQAQLQQPLPMQPIQQLQTRRPEEQQASQGQQSINTTGTQFAREDREVFDRVTLNFSGTVTELFQHLSEVSGLFFNESHGNVTIRRIETFSVTLPNYPELLNTIRTNIVALGGEDAAWDNISSSLTFKTNYRGYQRIGEYLRKVRDNAALVTMRIILLSVKLKDKKNFGVDWSQFYVGSGWTNTQQVLTGSASAAASTMQLAKGMAAAGGAIGSGGGINLLFMANNFNLMAFVGILDNYGSTEIVQNAFVECMSGTSGRFEATTETQYVKNIGVAALNNNSASTVGSTQTESVKYGAEVDIKPFYNAKDKSLVIDMNCNISELLGFNTYTTGNYGTLQLPEIQKKSIKNTLRLAHDQIAIIGGLIYTKRKSDSVGIPKTNTFLTRNNTADNEQQELVMVVKPTVFEFDI